MLTKRSCSTVTGIIAVLILNSLSAAVPPNFINTWAILGTFATDNNGGSDPFDPATLAPSVGTRAGGKTWQYFDDRIFSRNYDDYQDLYSYYSIKLNTPIAARSVYAHTWVYSPHEQQAQLRLGADTRIQAWLNGGEVPAANDANWSKDSAIASVKLQAGWNRLLLKISNQEDGRFGFYARFCTISGAVLPNLIYSVNGPADGTFAIATTGLTECASPPLPAAWKEWPYVASNPNTATIEADPYMLGFNQNPKLLMHASTFMFEAQGGRPPYCWNLSAGQLPPGLTLEPDGSIVGTVAAYAELKRYTFTVCAEDASGQTSRHEFSIEVKPRPNLWYEEARLVALMHAPETTPAGEIDDLIDLMKKQGYQLGMPISYHNGDMRYRWPSPFAGDRYTGSDTVQKYKDALEKAGLHFGMYLGNLNEKNALFSTNQQVLMVRQAIERYRPEALWCDWAGMDGESLDSLYSMIRTIDPHIVIVLNGYLRGSNGDWDEICFEGWTAWGKRMWDIWPKDFPWPKKHAPESWRLLTSPDSDKGPSDWREYLRVQISMIGEGFVADIDHSWGGPKYKKLNDSPLIAYHQNMANWANFKTIDGKTTDQRIPPLYTSYALVNPGPLAAASWGYNTINLSRDAIYLHIMKNPRGKTGLPAESTLTVSPLRQKTKSVVWMNQDKPLNFSQRGTSTDPSLTVDISTVIPDDIDTIIKIELASPIPADLPPEAAPAIPAGNLAFGKPGRLLSSNASQQMPANLGQRPDMAVDGNIQSTAAAGSFAWTYELDLQRLYVVNKAVLHFPENRFPTDYELLGSTNGTVWKSLKHLTNDSGGRHDISFDAAEIRYLRVKSYKPDGPRQRGEQMVIAELEMYGQQ